MVRPQVTGMVSLVMMAGLMLIGVARADLLSSTQTQSLLNAHNTLRLAVVPPAANMHILIYDPSLEALANTWAQQCSFSHPATQTTAQYGNIGQNVYEQSAALTNDLSGVVQSWYSESQWYTYSTNTCQAPSGESCGHYTQVVWASTVAVGCAFKVCPNLNGQTLLVCNYGPGGNVANTAGVIPPPYQSGPACTSCASGTGWCNNGFCASGCSAPSSKCACTQLTCVNGQFNSATCACQCTAGWMGTTCNLSCANTGTMCYPIMCPSTDPAWISYLATNCPSTCPGPCGPGQPVNPNINYSG